MANRVAGENSKDMDTWETTEAVVNRNYISGAEAMFVQNSLGAINTRTFRSLPLIIAVTLLCSFSLAGQNFRFTVIQRDLVLERLRGCPKQNLDREQQLQNYFAQAGCPGSELVLDQPRHSRFGNVVCTLRGSSDRQIVVGAHFDHVSVGAGVVDNWSGASLLPSLYEAVAAEPRRHRFVFIGFYGEEQGLVGSENYVRKIAKDKLETIDAMVNLDSLGLGPTNIWLSHADPDLAKLAISLANALKLPISGVNADGVASTDAESFREKKIPTISFSSVTQATLPILHSTKDQLAQVKEDDYYSTYRFLSAYLSYLDSAVPERTARKSR
ncbi:MAG TPA: M28 family peptidase [Terriglobales bacterium]|nr:M28 family peptidase [Terriglobales bacterium]